MLLRGRFKMRSTALALEMALLLKGQPGTGRTLLTHHVAAALGMELSIWNTTSVFLQLEMEFPAEAKHW